MPLSVDTTKPAVAEAALDAGADLLNDVWGVGDDDALARLAADHGVPLDRHAQPGRAALHDVPGRGDRRPPARRSSGRSRLGVRVGRPHRRSGLRLRQDARPQPRAAARARRRCACSAGRSCSGRRASRPSGGSSTCPPTSGSRRRSRRPRSAIAAGVDIVRVHDVRAERPRRPHERRGRPRRRHARPRKEARSERPDRARRTCTSRAATASTTRSSSTPQPFEVDVELVLDLQPAGRRRRPRRRPSTTARSTTRVRQIVESTVVPPARGAGRGDRHELLADVRTVDEVVVRVRKPDGPARRPARLRGRRDPAPRRARPLIERVPAAGARPRCARPPDLPIGDRPGPEPVDEATPVQGLDGRASPLRSAAVRASLTVRSVRASTVSPGENWRQDRVERMLACRSSCRRPCVMMSPSLMPAVVGRPAGLDAGDRVAVRHRRRRRAPRP